MTVIAEILRPMVCDSAVEPAVARSFADLTFFVRGFNTFRTNRWRFAKMLLDDKCAGREFISKQALARLKDTVERYKPKPPADTK